MLVRIVEAELRNFKNVEAGSVQFANYSAVQRRATIEKVDVEGIYGQNGSGKTAMVEALGILQDILRGRPISYRTYGELIDPDGKTSLRFKFYVENNGQKYLVEYEVHLAAAINGVASFENIPLFKERITYFTRGITWKGRQELFVQNSYYDPDAILSQAAPLLEKSHAGLFSDVPLLADPEKLLLVCAQKSTSVFFSDLLFKQLKNLENVTDITEDFRNILNAFNVFGRINFQVVKVNQLGIINLKTFLPMLIHERTDKSISHASLLIHPNNENVIDEASYGYLKNAIPSLNIALAALVPNLTIELHKLERTVDNDQTFIHVSIEAVRNGKHFSIRYESDGIQRIISLLSYLIALYNDPQICLVVDEFDDGIFEYLLGELIGVLGKEARGQLIFTSHNLRVLEKLDYKRILCTTTNPKNRYIHLNGVGANNNKRDFYIRSMVIGGQKEELYDNSNLEDISAAFRKAYLYRKQESNKDKRSRQLKKLQHAIAAAEEVTANA